jgi:hypothetical protein
MSMRDKDAMGGIAIALYALAVLLALLGALFLPPRIISTVFWSKWTFYVTFFVIVVGIPILLRLAQRSRIREAVQELGCRPLRLKRLPFWRQGYWPTSYFPGRTWWRGIVYEVDFLDPLGESHHALCRSGFLRGVQWMGELPT